VAAPKITMKNLISSAPQAQEIYQLKAKIDELEAELKQSRSNVGSSDLKEELETRVEELTRQLTAVSGEHEIAIALIDPDPDQPRKSFPQSVVQERAESLRRHGQQTPIILIPRSTGQYSLFEGELRTRGATLLGWEKLRAVFLQESLLPSQDEVLERQLITSIHSSRINDLDLAETIVRLLVHRHPTLEAENIPRLLQSALYQLDRSGQLSDLEQIRIANESTQQQWISGLNLRDSDEQKILALLLWLQLNPNSVKAHVFPLLNLPDDLKQAIRQVGIEPSKARELNKLSSEFLGGTDDNALKIRSQILQKVIEEKLSLSQIKTLVKDTLSQPDPTINVANQQMSRMVKRIETIRIDGLESADLKEVRQALQKKLKEIDAALRK
jgi:ParB family transcriptional regulator, chromosome partitioning protein